MTKTQKFNLALIIIAILGGVVSSLTTIADGNLYGTLIRLAIIPVMLAPFLIKKIFNKEMPISMETIYLIFVFFAHFMGSILNLYYTVDNYDKIMHLLSGLLSALLALMILVRYKKYDHKNIWYNVLFMIAFTTMIAAFWEMYEFKFDILFNKDAQRVLTTGVDDTMYDMASALIGGIIFISIYLYQVIPNKMLILEKIKIKFKNKD